MSFRIARGHWSRLYTIVLAAGLAVGFASPLSAQMIPRGPGRQPLVQPKPVHVPGTASADFLRSGLRGLVVEFQAEIDNHGVAQAKVGELTVTMPGKEK